MVGKIYAGILVDRVLIGSLIDDEQGSFRAERGCVNQVFTLKHIGEKAREKKCTAYVGFMDLNKAYDRVNKKSV